LELKGKTMIKNKQLNRRDFLKSLGILLLAPFIARSKTLFDTNKRTDSKGLRQAKYFKEGSHLAG